ncbi:exodeoxyribonuclease VII large subunit [Sedimentibacter acidaminivorans]|uniref:Exodeoxyribonuclease 7 large subunit n=1 Tax=Sedimentibacter acidaminivorans TaxID=913099 RepID=A0ABS4GCJ6_9FIRM|nr:exodeoxyribonuclease VII large subunit [Sedimentibacter acidaminivorans]MBP1925421.1 exodeoxyribonuclease VII large subunit [Sedimentibacter acidaminivorans]
MKLKPIKVSQLNQFIKKYLSSNSILNNLRVEGEISNLRTSKTGYTYFTLCDDSSCINCVCFYTDSISKNGDKVVIDGELSVYEARGSYQIIVKSIERIGMGKILQDLELLKGKLKAKGMFEKNKPLPLYPENIGIITSKTGAAIKDILKTFESVKANIEITIYNALVQGDNSKQYIIDGIKKFNEDNVVDVILISRGGGSFEDLNIFNDINIAEEAFKSNIPIVTGIGHESDRTLIDYVADVYCHTPTAAAERIIRGYKDIQTKLESLIYNLKSSTKNYINIKSSELKSSKYILRSYLPLEEVYTKKNQLENYKHFIKNQLETKLNKLDYQLNIMREKIINNNYNKQLEKGLPIVSNDIGNIIKDISQVNEKTLLNINFKDFIITARTISVKEVKHDEK